MKLGPEVRSPAGSHGGVRGEGSSPSSSSTSLGSLKGELSSGVCKSWQGGFGRRGSLRGAECGDRVAVPRVPSALLVPVLMWASSRLLQDFNRHLDTLTEHYDIPKVSWTK